MPSLTGDFDLSLGGVMGLTAMVVGVQGRTGPRQHAPVTAHRHGRD